MIVRITKKTNAVNVVKQAAVRVRIARFNIPSGILTSNFTQKGSLLAGTGPNTFVELPPGSDNQFLMYDESQPAGMRPGTPVVTVNDPTNFLINGRYDFAQRQTPETLTTIGDGRYSADRWKCYRANADLQYRRVNATGEGALTSQWHGEYKKITNTGKFLVCQPLEFSDSVKFRGKTVSFQIAMKASGAKTIRMAILQLQSGGTADTIPAVVSSWGSDGNAPTLGANLAVISTPVSCAVTTSWQVFQFTATFPSDGKNLIAAIWTDAGFAANDTLSVAEAGVYFGATLRSWSPRPVGEETGLVERYFEKSYDVTIAPATNTSTGRILFPPYNPSNDVSSYPVRFRVQKVKIPTVTLYAGDGTLNRIDIVDSGAKTSVDTTAVSIGINGFQGWLAAGTTGAPSDKRTAFQFTAEAEL